MPWKQNGHFPWASRCLYPRVPAESTCVTSAFPDRCSRKWGSNTTPPSDVNSSSRCTPNKPLTITVKAHWTCLKDFKNERISVWMLQQNWNFSVCIFSSSSILLWWFSSKGSDGNDTSSCDKPDMVKAEQTSLYCLLHSSSFTIIFHTAVLICKADLFGKDNFHNPLNMQ